MFIKFTLSRAIIIYCSVFFAIMASAQNQISFNLIDSLESKIEISEGISPTFIQSTDNKISYFSENDSGIVSVERIYFDTITNKLSTKTYKVRNMDIEQPYCISIAFKDKWLFLFGQEVISKYKLSNGKYALYDSYKYINSQSKISDMDDMIALDSNRLLFINTFPRNQDLNSRMLILDFDKRRIIKEMKIAEGKAQLLNYEAVIDHFDYLNNKIIFSPSGTNLINIYDLNLKKNATIELPFYTNTNIQDTINKYLTESFVKENIYSPKAIISILGKKYGKDIFSMQQIRSAKFLNDSLIIAVVNTIKMDFYKENVIYLININTNKISYSIENLPIDYFSYDLPHSYYRGINAKGKNFIVLGDEKFDDTTNTIKTIYKIYERVNINSFIDNSLKLNTNTYFVYNFKNEPVKINLDLFDDYVIIDEYNCKNCIFDKSIKILFLSTNLSSTVENYKLFQSYKKEYPNSELYFINPKYYNLEKLMNIPTRL